MNNNREQLLRKVQEYNFAMLDSALFLDTHPEDIEALNFYHKARDLYEAAVKEYEECFGPLSLTGVQSDNCWTWALTPWPWNMEA